MQGQSELKVPGGKLLRADVQYEDKITDVELHGDFFIYPEDALDDIEAAFTGLPVAFNEDEAVNSIINNLEDTVELVGFEPKHVAQVVDRAVQGDTDED